VKKAGGGARRSGGKLRAVGGRHAKRTCQGRTLEAVTNSVDVRRAAQTSKSTRSSEDVAQAGFMFSGFELASAPRVSVIEVD